MKSLNLKISARDSRHNDSRVLLKALFDQWLPLSSSLLSMVIDKLPSPTEILSERVEKLMCSGVRTFDSLPDETQSLKDGELRRLFSLSFLAVVPNLFQRAKNVVSDSPGLVDFAIGLVKSVFNLPNGQVMFFEEFE